MKMPQGRRKVPFSSKQKKIQLQEKRLRKKDPQHSNVSSSANEIADDAPKFVSEKKAPLLTDNALIDKSRVSERYKIVFKKENQDEVKRNREKAYQPIDHLPEEALEVNYNEFYVKDEGLDIPKRPPWDFTMEKRTLEAQEERYFRNYVYEIQQKFGHDELSYFELNLETWRQLWRVLEMSDIVLLVADIRHPILHFPPGLYAHVTRDLKKEIILVLNKIDLVAPALVLAWKLYFQEHFPLLHLLCFSSFGGMPPSTSRKGRRKGKLRMAAEGAKILYAACEKIVNGAVNLSSWKEKIEDELTSALESDNAQDEDYDNNPLANASVNLVPADTGHYQGEQYANGILTLGFVGHPNVGKSSLLNAVMGRKVVSVSRTPGHTKHFQTIFLTHQVRLCDCPGLVFPSKVPKAMQVLSGCYPIAQLREPYNAVGYLAQRVDVPKMLHLKHPDEEENHGAPEWSSYSLCEGWAIQRGFRTARAARPDVHRAANNLLRMALDGRTLCLKFYPPGYTKNKSFFLAHPELADVRRLQGHFKDEAEGESLATGVSGYSSEDEGLSSDEDAERNLPRAHANKFAVLLQED